MNVRVAPALVLILLVSSSNAQPTTHAVNRPPLHASEFAMLPLGSITPGGWMTLQLNAMKTGLTGHLDEYYSQVAGKRNAWLGGDGDAWERGPYWIDGLLPLAYILHDQALIAKVKPWVEWTLTHQRPDGYIGPDVLKNKPTDEPGIQKGPREDWWPRMVMLKILQQHYEATQDKRVIDVLTRYFRYQLSNLPTNPLDRWSFWGNRRGADNLMVVYWLYNITGDEFLIELGDLLYQQTFPFTDVFLHDHPEKENGVSHLYPYNVGNTYPFKQELIQKLHVGQLQSFHCVNLAQGLKTPVIYYQRDPNPKYVSAVKKALNDIDLFHGQAQGMYGGDEPLHGNAPTQGVEFCSIVEMMFSLESMLAITGDVAFADRLEKIAYNALPTQATDDFMNRQYFQCANQVLITRGQRNFFEDGNHGGTDQCFGLLTGYPCCTSNMHQGWPKFIQNTWYRTPDNGLAALVYAPSSVEATVGHGEPVRITEETNYPFDEKVLFKMTMKKNVRFDFQVRIPAWATGATITVNSAPWTGEVKAGTIVRIDREWKNGDRTELNLPMKVSVSRWAESSAAIERGPLVYALKIEEEWKTVAGSDHYGSYLEVYPRSDWNYGIPESVINDPVSNFEVVRNEPKGAYPWNSKNVPIQLKTKGKKLSEWKIYNNMAGPLPNVFTPTKSTAEEIVLIPYGCSTLRIAQFPVVR
ncbi:beta-L-arabinofuranosidase domain-containing protein [Chryseolinea sp. T2]|uniref:beta-L-arabinofuranosidase domain-containing protein n=1 Tax=Chryseolinea sp. T2 TaxID=3129255 RepID=UPI0030768C02